MPLVFAALVGLILTFFHYKIVSPGKARLAKMGLYWLVMLIWVYKLAIGLTTGHVDITRFIIFVQNFARHPLVNPWDFFIPPPFSDFPYPPLLLYLHSFLFFIFSPLISASPDINPMAYTYTLFKIPLIVFDLILFGHLLRMGAKQSDKKFRGLLVSYLLCTIVLFHQYYSGQLDLIAAVPFFLACMNLEETKAFTWKGFLLLTLSLCFKPFCVLLLPFFVMRYLELKDFHLKRLGDRRVWLEIAKLGAMLLAAVAVFKLSELPFSMTASYRAKMGTGSKLLFDGTPFVGPPLFPYLYGGYALLTLVFGAILRRKTPIFFHALIVILLIGATTTHSAGWMTWGCMGFFYYLMYRKPLGVTDWTLWAMWNIAFVIRWATVDHSPVADSLGILASKFLGMSTELKMGYLYLKISENFGKPLAESVVLYSHFSFSAISAAFVLFATIRHFGSAVSAEDLGIAPFEPKAIQVQNIN